MLGESWVNLLVRILLKEDIFLYIHAAHILELVKLLFHHNFIKMLASCN